MDVPHHAHDLCKPIATTWDRNAASNAVAAKEPARQGLVDQNDVRRSGAIPCVEETPGDQGDSERAEVVRRNDIEARSVLGARGHILR
jgi:hypothetical protein